MVGKTKLDGILLPCINKELEGAGACSNLQSGCRTNTHVFVHQATNQVFIDLVS